MCLWSWDEEFELLEKRLIKYGGANLWKDLTVTVIISWLIRSSMASQHKLRISGTLGVS